ncbi:MAG: zinc-dependent metalloprotease [Rhodothermaceae bacterium]|nr:zinc-dependent metalloprotease [Rhodothermaceae bacterium]
MNWKQTVCIPLAVLLYSFFLVPVLHAQVVIKERVEVDLAKTDASSNQDITGIGFVAPRDGTLEVDLVSAFRAGLELFTDIAEFVELNVFVNEEEVLSDIVFARQWSVTVVQNDVVCGPDVLPSQTYTRSGTFSIGDVVAGDEVTLRFQTPFAVYGAVIDFDLDSSFIVENGEEWSVEFIGNGRFEAVGGFFQCTIPREELKIDVGYSSGTGGGPDISFLVENPSTNELEPTDFLEIGHWENAYELESDGSLTLVDGNPVVKNEDGDNFITADPDRFYVQVIDSEANIPDPDGNPVQDFITIQLETLTPDGVTDEAPQIVVLGESDVDTGVFLSAPQLLVTREVDPSLNPLLDDQFEANNNMSSFMDAYEAYAQDLGLPLAGTVKDNDATDPTHRAGVGWEVAARYAGSSGLEETQSATVCNPSEIKEVDVFTYVFDEPYIDEGFIDSNQDFVAGVAGEFDWEGKNYDIPFEDAYAAYLANPNVPSEAYIDFSTPPEERAGVTPKPGNEQKSGSSWGPVISSVETAEWGNKAVRAWAQACITVTLVDVDVSTSASFNTHFIDGRLDLEEDLALIEAERASAIVDDIIHVFIVGDNNQGYGGLAVSEEWGPSGDGQIDAGDPAYIIMSPRHVSDDSVLDMILSHEIGHMITNLHVPDSMQGDQPAPEYIFFPRRTLSNDDHYGKSRRITKETEAATEGSRFLKTPN